MGFDSSPHDFWCSCLVCRMERIEESREMREFKEVDFPPIVSEIQTLSGEVIPLPSKDLSDPPGWQELLKELEEQKEYPDE